MRNENCIYREMTCEELKDEVKKVNKKIDEISCIAFDYCTPSYKESNIFFDKLTFEELKDEYNILSKKLFNIASFLSNNYDNVSDGYHTFNELYYHRMILFSCLCSAFKDKSWKSKLHHDGTMFEDYFIVGINTPAGQYTYHYNMQYWDFFCEVADLEKAPEWDGHKPEDILRLKSLFDYLIK